MNPAMLAEICERAGLKEVNASYFGKFSVWLENEKEKSTGVRLFKKAVWVVGKVVTRIIPIETKGLSPYIILTAKKSI